MNHNSIELRSATSSAEAMDRRLMTIPNILCAVRLIGSLALVPLALTAQPEWILGLFLILSATDWIDGKLAIWLDQRSTFGARLDSYADATMYAALLFAGVWLKGRVLQAEWIWIAVALLAFAASCCAALWKFRRLPNYHTRTAKTAWLLMVVAAVALFLDWSVWPLRVAMLGVALANAEALLITAILPRWRADVISCLVAFRLRKSDYGPGEVLGT